MISISLVLIFVANLSVSVCKRRGITPHSMSQEQYQPDEAKFGDAEQRGPEWYDYQSSQVSEARNSSSSSSSTASNSRRDAETASGSAQETSEEKIANRAYRTCTPCPHDMLRKYTNLGIKWICAGYQRARRSFKSECMMRFRNCQDGTLFVKVADRRCKDDSYHGRHWFYVYQV